jgi:hypothetical protein
MRGRAINPLYEKGPEKLETPLMSEEARRWARVVASQSVHRPHPAPKLKLSGGQSKQGGNELSRAMMNLKMNMRIVAENTPGSISIDIGVDSEGLNNDTLIKSRLR